jgi:hypothetical protein
MYDQFAGFEAPQYETSKKPFVTPHQNRDDMTNPYNGHSEEQKQFASNRIVISNSSASVEFWRWFTGQITKDEIAQCVNRSFTRNDITGDNYDKQKEKYSRLYGELLKA